MMRLNIHTRLPVCFVLLLLLSASAAAAPAVGIEGSATLVARAGTSGATSVIWHTVASGESLWSISRAYGMTVADLSRLNANPDPQNLQPGTRLLIGSVRSSTVTTFSWPVRGTITSRFGLRHGERHTGLDIGAPYGTVIVAARAGLVITASWLGNYGRAVLLDHGGDVRTLYAHASKLLVKAGDWVESGEAVARIGTSGRSTGPHVHFEVRVTGNPIDPLTVLR